MRGGDDAKPAAEENNVASDGTLNDSQEDSETAGSESNTKRLNEKADEPEAAATSSGSDKESASKSSNAAAKDSSIDNAIPDLLLLLWFQSKIILQKH